MKYVIVIPAYNEEKFIGGTIESISSQTLLPEQLIIVNDGSTDNTDVIVKEYCKKYFWIKLISDGKKTKHSGGAKVVKAFKKGYGAISVNYDVIVKLDADLILPEDYFEKVMNMFLTNSKIGIAGGIHRVLKNGKWVSENLADSDHVHGAYKSYRSTCFEQIGGPRTSIGWDTLDELLARYHGWEIQTDHSLSIVHNRVTGTETGILRVKSQIGWSWYRMRYGFFISVLSAIKLGAKRQPKLISGLFALYGWFQAWIRGDEFIVNEKEGRFIREFRRRRMNEKLRTWKDK